MPYFARFLPGTPASDYGGPSIRHDAPNDKGADAPADADATKGADTPADKAGEKPEGKVMTQAEIDAIVEERLQRDRKTREREAAKAKEAEAAAAGEHKTLAEQRGARIEELEPKAERADRYAEVLNRQAEATVAAWPAELKALDPGPEDLDARLAWIEKSRPLAEKLGAAPVAPDTDAGKGGRPTPGGGAEKGGEKNGTGAKTERFRFVGSNDVKW